MSEARPESASGDTEAHRAFLNRYYGISRYFYDLTRKYYLFGRDRALKGLYRDPSWKSLIEIGPGTGRNLRKIHARRPDAALGGVEASDAMLTHAAERCPWAKLKQGFAETTDMSAVLGEPPDRVLFSYCLTMVHEPKAALDNARRGVAKGGHVLVVDFADLDGLPGPAKRSLGTWLRTFHVEPDRMMSLLPEAAHVTYGPGRYYVIARFDPT